MPVSENAQSWLPNTMMFQCLASKFTKIAEFKKPFRTLAFGALTYADAKIGARLKKPELHDFLQLRVYHVGYSRSAIGSLIVEVKEVATGT
ncbi:MAG: hypothetical protein Q9164_004607, partial [Protoblastenia rupestris]